MTTRQDDQAGKAEKKLEYWDLAPAGEWMPTNLPWLADFWPTLPAERLMRLNPHWHMESLEDGRWQVEDILAEREFATGVELEPAPDGFDARFDGPGLTLRAREAEGMLELRYDLTQGSLNEQQAARDMYYWLASVREYYRLYTADTWRTRFWRLLMNRVLLTMNPTQRRVCSFMLKFTLLEMALIIALGVGAYFYFK